MRHLITLIGPDGSIKTSSDENISVEERDNNEDIVMMYYFFLIFILVGGGVYMVCP